MKNRLNLNIKMENYKFKQIQKNFKTIYKNR